MIFNQSYTIVTPGELLADSGRGLNGTYTEDKKIFSKYFGNVIVNGDNISVVPISGIYVPQEGDDVIGRVAEVNDTYWVVDIDAPYFAKLSIMEANTRGRVEDISTLMDIDDILYARVYHVSQDKSLSLTFRGGRYGKLPPRMIVKINPVKTGRVIGKEGSMIKMIKEYTNCEILVGSNGVIWLNGDEAGMAAASSAIKLIDKEYYSQGLTEKVKNLLEYVRGKV